MWAAITLLLLWCGQGFYICILFKVSRKALGPPSLLFNGYRGVLFPRVHKLMREADHSPQSSDQVKNVWSQTFTIAYGFKLFSEATLPLQITLLNKIAKEICFPIFNISQ
jgi:hypothetical protein